MKRLIVPLCSLLLCILCLPSFVYAKIVTGTVYEDKNQNGSFDPKEKGIKGVPVSNGSSVVLTDKKGIYKIELSDGDTLFISKPAGFSVPLDVKNLPRFYFNYSPDGTSADLEFRYPGLKPSGEIEDNLDFPLFKQKESDSYDVILTSDPQTATDEELDYYRDRIVAELAGKNAAFGITAGDIVFDDLSLFARYAEITGRVGIPWFNVPGNHDVNYLSPDDSRALDTFKRYFGPAYYSFDWGKAHYVILDSIFYKGTDPEERNASGGYLTKLDEKQLKWLEADLSFVPKSRLIVLVMHAPIRPVGPDDPEQGILNRRELFDLLSGFDNVFAIAGHMHSTQHVYFDNTDGFRGKKPLHQHIITTASGSWWTGMKDVEGIPHSYQVDGTPNGYHIMSVNGNKYSLRYKAAGKPDDCQMRIMLEKQPGRELISSMSLSEITDIQIVVNLFDGGPESTISCSIDNGDTFSLKHDSRVDMFTFNSFKDLDVFVSGREFPSSHIWSGSLNEKIEPGTHTITVRAIDEYGREHTGRKIFEVRKE